MSYDLNNIFAKILRGELPKVTVYEDAQTLAFMDIMPSVEGHTLVISKEAAENILDLSSDGSAALIQTVQKVARAVKKALSCSGLMLAQLNGAAAGQSVQHVHFHILPRMQGADLCFHGGTKARIDELEAVAAKIRAALES